MPFNKYFFSQFKDEIKEEKEKFKAHSESSEVPATKCDHKGKVKAVPGGIKCQCGVGWQGMNVAMLLKHFKASHLVV